MNRTKLRFLLMIFSCFVLKIMAQSNNMKDTVNVIVFKVFQPTISDAFKINDNPNIVDSTKKIPALNYGILSKQIKTGFDIEPISPAKMIGEPLAKLYNTLLKGGIGNYTTPYGELFYNNLRSKEYSYGAHAKHLSSYSTLKNSKFSGYSDNEINIYGKKFLSMQTLSGSIDYTRSVVNFYGNDLYGNSPLITSPKEQKFQFINPKLQLTSFYKDSSKINHDIKVGYYFLKDKYKAVENVVLVNAAFKGYLEKELLTLNTEINYYNNKTAVDTTNNTIVLLNPNISSVGKKWKANLGLTAAIDINSTTKYHFYPNISFQYKVIGDVLIPYAGIEGGLTKNSFKTVSDNNPFIVSNPFLKNTNKVVDAFIGVRGTIEAATTFNLKGSYSIINDALFYVNDTLSNASKNRFNIIYDDIKLLNLHGELGHQQTEKLRLFLKADYFKYTMDKEIAPWHKPSFELTFSGNYDLKNKIIAKADLFVLAKQNGKSFDTTSTPIKKELKGIADINLGLEYRYNKRLSAFVNFNNIGAFRYYRWLQYPSQRFNFLLGFSYVF